MGHNLLTIECSIASSGTPISRWKGIICEFRYTNIKMEGYNSDTKLIEACLQRVNIQYTNDKGPADNKEAAWIGYDAEKTCANQGDLKYNELLCQVLRWYISMEPYYKNPQWWLGNIVHVQSNLSHKSDKQKKAPKKAHKMRNMLKHRICQIDPVLKTCMLCSCPSACPMRPIILPREGCRFHPLLNLIAYRCSYVHARMHTHIYAQMRACM